MATAKVQVCPSLTYPCYINFWNWDGAFYFYRTLIATDASKITSAKLQFQVHVPDTGTRRIFEWFVNDKKVYRWDSAWTGVKEARLTGEVDVSDSIMPLIGYAGKAANKITFGCHNPLFPLMGFQYDIDYAYLILEYSGAAPEYPATPETTSQGATSTTGNESLDQMFGYMMQFMMLFMMMSMMTSMMGTFKEMT